MSSSRSEYDTVPKSGALKLKKLDHTIKKKKKKKEEKRILDAPNNKNGQGDVQTEQDIEDAIEAKIRERNPLMNKTKAELRFIKQQEKIKEKWIIEKASKTHKNRVEDFNKHLDNLTEHFDIPKVSWTK
ncbi:Protein FAM32A [Orchesella cincta]|uniref:Protein FAM32A n=1 Tax=Orchesella cincta TaxID=48709 RepID=A0A1D2NDZ0_ORCCI|nr:Protein FAM32A [Orchesella cincta]